MTDQEIAPNIDIQVDVITLNPCCDTDSKSDAKQTKPAKFRSLQDFISSNDETPKNKLFVEKDAIFNQVNLSMAHQFGFGFAAGLFGYTLSKLFRITVLVC